MIKIIDKYKMDYLESISQMEELVENIINCEAEEEIWFLEYDNLYTSGTSQNLDINNINSIPIFQTNRGGKMTFHGKGQIIVYFILDLKKMFSPNQPDILKFVYLLEEVIIKSLADISITSNRLPINHGAWIKNNKIAAIGIRLKRWIAYHGIAINFDTNLTFYDYISPCGLTNEYGITSIKKELQTMKITKEEFIEKIKNNIKWMFVVDQKCSILGESY